MPFDEDIAGPSVAEEMQQAKTIWREVGEQLARWSADPSCCPPIATEWAADRLGWVAELVDWLDEEEPDGVDLELIPEVRADIQSRFRALFTLGARAPGLDDDARGDLREGDKAQEDFFTELDAWRGVTREA